MISWMDGLWYTRPLVVVGRRKCGGDGCTYLRFKSCLVCEGASERERVWWRRERWREKNYRLTRHSTAANPHVNFPPWLSICLSMSPEVGEFVGCLGVECVAIKREREWMWVNKWDWMRSKQILSIIQQIHTSADMFENDQREASPRITLWLTLADPYLCDLCVSRADHASIPSTIVFVCFVFFT